LPFLVSVALLYGLSGTGFARCWELWHFSSVRLTAGVALLDEDCPITGNLVRNHPQQKQVPQLSKGRVHKVTKPNSRCKQHIQWYTCNLLRLDPHSAANEIVVTANSGAFADARTTHA
jgi:hypothetical protein